MNYNYNYYINILIHNDLLNDNAHFTTTIRLDLVICV